MRVHQENKIILTMSPKELRDLADKMEERWPMVVLHLDQTYFHDLAKVSP
jgi:hypothetical protein